MRARSIFASVLLLAPTALSAQRIPLPIGRRGPAHPEPLPPQPTPIAMQLAYTRSHLSVETYPMVSFNSAPGLAGPGRAGSWASIGAGTHADYRLTRFMSATMDLTSSLFGGPALTQTAEVGARFNKARGEGRWYPYADVRVGYVASYLNNGSLGNVFVDPVTQRYYADYSHGFGGIVGAGFEYALDNAFSIMTGASLLRGGLSQHSLESPVPADRHYSLTSIRYTLGLRFNPVYALHPGRTEKKSR
jgi:hypothetical protein